jgi:hypothetical protein
MSSSNYLLSTNYVDRVSMYMSGDNFYFKFGKSPDLINIAPYQGNGYESEYYFEKFQNKAIEVVEKRLPRRI